MTSGRAVVDEDGPREVRRGHMTQTRASIVDGRVRIVRQKRMHKFDSGMHNTGPPVPIWSGSLDEAKHLHEMLELLLYDEDALDVALD